jgi:hypothetical protein
MAGAFPGAGINGRSRTAGDLLRYAHVEQLGWFQGDFFALLSHGSGLAILLNRVGVSSSNAVGCAHTGFGTNAQQARFTLDDHASQDVHF